MVDNRGKTGIRHKVSLKSWIDEDSSFMGSMGGQAALLEVFPGIGSPVSKEGRFQRRAKGRKGDMSRNKLFFFV